MSYPRFYTLGPYSKSLLTLALNEWRFNLSFSRVSMLFLNSWRVSVVPYYVATQHPAIQNQHRHSRKAQFFRIFLNINTFRNPSIPGLL
jgi:hypothetical protein